MSVRRIGWLTLIAAVVSFAPALTQAQDIRQYGDQGEGSEGSSSSGGNTGTYYPGQPVPQQESQSSEGQTRQTGQNEEKQEGKQEDSSSYRIRLHNPSNSEDSDGGKKTSKSSQSAAEMIEKTPEKIYGGIIPGMRNTVDHFEALQREGSEPSKPNRLTWLGFKPEQTRTRIFLQTSRPVEYEMSRERDGRRIVLTLQNTTFASKNFSRTIDASYFERNVQTVRARQRGNQTVRVEIDLKKAEKPSVSIDGNYLYTDFPVESSEDSQTQASRSQSSGE